MITVSGLNAKLRHRLCTILRGKRSVRKLCFSVGNYSRGVMKCLFEGLACGLLSILEMTVSLLKLAWIRGPLCIPIGRKGKMPANSQS